MKCHKLKEMSWDYCLIYYKFWWNQQQQHNNLSLKEERKQEVWIRFAGSNTSSDVNETFLLQGLDGLLDANFQGYVVYAKAPYPLLGHLVRRNIRILIRTPACVWNNKFRKKPNQWIRIFRYVLVPFRELEVWVKLTQNVHSLRVVKDYLDHAITSTSWRDLICLDVRIGYVLYINPSRNWVGECLCTCVKRI